MDTSLWEHQRPWSAAAACSCAADGAAGRAAPDAADFGDDEAFGVQNGLGPGPNPLLKQTNLIDMFPVLPTMSMEPSFPPLPCEGLAGEAKSGEEETASVRNFLQGGEGVSERVSSAAGAWVGAVQSGKRVRSCWRLQS
jgi:hypothetical protein